MDNNEQLPTILIVNDDSDMLKLMSAQISSLGGIHIIQASNGEEAIHLLDEHTPAAIFCDINMPRLNGFQLCQILKTSEFSQFSQVPIVLTSATYRDVVAEQVARDVGAYAYLQQPHEEADLLRLARHTVGWEENIVDDPSILAYRGTVAVIDDDPDILTFLSEVLAVDSWRVLTASSGKEGMRLLQDDRVQIILLDYQIPDISGRDILAHIRRKFSDRVVIMMTGHGSEEIVVDLIRAGADDYVRKPFEASDVQNACRRAHGKFSFLRIHAQFQEKIDRLKEIGTYLDHLISHSEESIFSCDVIGRVRVWNRAANRIYGYSASEIQGKIVDEYLDPPGQTRKATDVVNILQERGAFTDKEIWRKRKDGTTFPVTAIYSPITNPHGSLIGFSVIEHDMTAAKRLEEELIKSERLSAITQLAVTTNDQVNTPLGVILGYAQFLQRKIDALPVEDVHALQTIEKQVLKIKDIMNQLKRLSDPMVKEYSIEGVEMLDLIHSK